MHQEYDAGSWPIILDTSGASSPIQSEFGILWAGGRGGRGRVVATTRILCNIVGSYIKPIMYRRPRLINSECKETLSPILEKWLIKVATQRCHIYGAAV